VLPKVRHERQADYPNKKASQDTAGDAGGGNSGLWFRSLSVLVVLLGSLDRS
jgi:hypothetical protein